MTAMRPGVDLAIIGSGSAAFAAAIAATGKGGSVVLVERGTTGGTCVNVGCVPSKALLAAAEARYTAAAAGRFPGLTPSTGPVDFPALIGGKDALVTRLRAEKYTDLAAEYGWEIVHGTATFAGNGDVPVLDVALAGGGTRRVEAAHYLIATGSAPWAPPVPGLEQAGYLTSTSAMELDHLPESMLVVGGNAVGLEQAQFFARLGTRVTVVEALARLAPFEEPEVSAAIEEVFIGGGITVHTTATLVSVRAEDGERIATVRTRTGSEIELRTALVADNALDGAERTLDYTALPRVTFTSPAIAAVGMTDAQVVGAGIRCDCRTLPLEYAPRALVNRDTRGLVKIVAEAGSGRLLGVHVVADGAGDVITAATYAITAGLTVEQLAHTWAPYLTMAEALKLAALTYTRDVTKLSCCAG